MRLFLVALVLALACSHATLAHYRVKLDLHRQKILGNDLSRQLEIIQEGIAKDLKFDSVAEAIEFLQNCHHVQRAVRHAPDSRFNGIAGEIKFILDEEMVDDACSVNEAYFKELFSTFDQDYSLSLGSVSDEKIDELMWLQEKVKSNDLLTALVGHLIAQKVDKFIPKVVAE